jgi:hypothetical protein
MCGVSLARGSLSIFSAQDAVTEISIAWSADQGRSYRSLRKWLAWALVVEKSAAGIVMATRVNDVVTARLCDFVHQCPGREVAVTSVVDMSLLGAEQVLQPNAAVENQVNVVSVEHDERAPGRVHR